MKRFLVLFGFLLAWPLLGLQADPQTVEPELIRPIAEAIQGQAKPNPKAHGRGHITPKNIKELHRRSWAQHGGRLANLPKVIAQTWDCRTLGTVGPVRDQGSCGSCWCVSATGVIDSAMFVSGNWKNDGTNSTSDQYVMDCGQNGGCNGDDASTVLDMAKGAGLPLTAAYGPYVASSGNCKDTSKMVFWKLAVWGYCTQNQGIGDTQDIKKCIVAYGPISSAVDAGGFNGYSSGVMSGDGNNVDHDVSIAGWDDNKAGGCWLVKNQWGTDWGEKGYCWIPYGKWSIGTSAAWCSAVPPPVPPVPPVPPPGPTPPPPGPDPVPPVPPAPGPGPLTFTFTFTPAPFSFQTGGFRSRTVTVTPPTQTITGTINQSSK